MCAYFNIAPNFDSKLNQKIQHSNKSNLAYKVLFIDSTHLYTQHFIQGNLRIVFNSN